MFAVEKRIVLTLGFIAIASVAQATIITNHLYRMGEDDSGAVPGGAATTTSDSAGGWDVTGTGTYSPNTPGPLSSLAISFNGSSDTFRTGSALMGGVTDNFGLEAWVKMSSSSNGIIAYNGDTGGNGYGILLNEGAYKGMFGGVDMVGSATATTDWTHLALVRDNGTATLYVNGVSAGTLGNGPNSVSGRFSVGCKPQEDVEFFGGLVDHVRLFYFNAGEFQVSDLSTNMVPEPSALVLLAISLVGLLAYAWRKRR